MSNFGKMLFTMLFILVVITYIVFRIDTIHYTSMKNSYERSIRSSTQTAASKILSSSNVNYTYDGDIREINDIPVDLDTMWTFRNAIKRLLTSARDGYVIKAQNINVPMAGIASYNYIIGLTYDDVWLPPRDYTKYMSYSGMPAELNNKTWHFTLGDRFTVEDRTYQFTGNIIERVFLSELEAEKALAEHATTPSYSYLPNQTVYNMDSFLTTYKFNTSKAFRDYIVTDCIDNYLNDYSGASFNPIANNTHMMNVIELGKEDYSKDYQTYQSKSAIIDGPTLFAIVDVYTGTLNNKNTYMRVASFGGTELKEAH